MTVVAIYTSGKYTSRRENRISYLTTVKSCECNLDAVRGSPGRNSFRVRQPTAREFFVIDSVDALDSIKQATECDLRIHSTKVLIGEPFQMCFPFGLEVRVENVAF